MAKIPVLVDDEHGGPIGETSVILDYLDQRFPQAPQMLLFPPPSEPKLPRAIISGELRQMSVRRKAREPVGVPEVSSFRRRNWWAGHRRNLLSRDSPETSLPSGLLKIRTDQFTHTFPG